MDIDVSKIKAIQVDLPMLVAELTDHSIETVIGDVEVEVIHLTYNFPGYKYSCVVSVREEDFTSGKITHNNIQSVLSGRMHYLMIKGIDKDNE